MTSTAQLPELEEQSCIWGEAWQCIEKYTSKRLSAVAESRNISEFHLRLRTLLQLPRHSFEHLLNRAVIDIEIESEAEKIRNLQSDFRHFLQGHPIPILRRKDAYVDQVAESVARIIHERFHYIETFRGGQHFGLYVRGETRLAALATVSPMDVVRLRHYIPGAHYQRSMMLSRVFAFPWAPRNSLSFLLASVAKELQEKGGVDQLLTWVNPNLFFHGASYRAANWHLAGNEPVVYRYMDGAYVTARQLHEQGKRLPSRLSLSRFSLAPLEVWHYILQ